MPSLRLYEGDFGVLLAMMRKMNDQLAMNGSAITALARDISALQAVVRPPESCSGSPPVPARRPQPLSIQPQSHTSTVTVNNRAGKSGDRSAEPADGYMTSGNSDSLPVMHYSNNNNEQFSDSMGAILKPKAQCANNSDDEQNSDSGRFTEQRSARVARAKRRRERSDQQRSAVENANERQHETFTYQPRRRPVMTGKAHAINSNIKKLVYYVDNVSTSFNAEDMKSFVTGMAVDVISCFEVKPRRRRSDDDDDAVSRKAFRLCVNAADCQRLLDPCKWPDSVMIYEWFFKAANPGDRRPIANDERQCPAEPTTVDATSADLQQTDMDCLLMTTQFSPGHLRQHW